MRSIPFWKMSGSGNDFVVIDNRRGAVRGNLSAWARRLCHRQFGVGADGLLLLCAASEVRRSKPAIAGPGTSELGAGAPDFRMVYYNADGSRATMCGNGARCLAWAAHAWGVTGRRPAFQTDAGPVQGEVDGEMVRITLSAPRNFQPERSVKALGRTYRLAFIDTGVPHAVVPVRNAESVDILAEGRALRFHPAFGRPGTNVNFVQRLGGRKLRVRTYERGVEGETLACGTGVTASALAAALRGWVRPVVRCVTTGGDTLEVDFRLHPETPAHPASQVTLKGPVRRTFIGEWSKVG